MAGKLPDWQVSPVTRRPGPETDTTKPACTLCTDAGRRRPGQPCVPRPGSAVPLRTGGDPAVSRHRYRHPVSGQNARAGPAGGTGVADRLRRQRPDCPGPRACPAELRARGQDRLPGRRRPRPGHDLGAGGADAGLQQAGRRHDASHLARGRGSVRADGHAGRRGAAGQLPGDLGPCPRHPARSPGRADPPHEREHAGRHVPPAEPEVDRFFDGLELLEPGVVPVNYWRPGPGGPDPARKLQAYAAVGRKR